LAFEAWRGKETKADDILQLYPLNGGFEAQNLHYASAAHICNRYEVYSGNYISKEVRSK
jgi:hypothetical protein